MSEKNCDIILMISFTICLILMIVRFVRLIIIGLEPINLITFGIVFFFILGWAMIFICLKRSLLNTNTKKAAVESPLTNTHAIPTAATSLAVNCPSLRHFATPSLRSGSDSISLLSPTHCLNTQLIPTYPSTCKVADFF